MNIHNEAPISKESGMMPACGRTSRVAMAILMWSTVLVGPGASAEGVEPVAEKARVELLSQSWRFPVVEAARSTLTASSAQAEFAVPGDATKGFTIVCTVEVKPFVGERTILEWPQVVKMRLRQHKPGDRNRDNYQAFPMPDGSLPVLEATIALHSDGRPKWKDMTIGIPLARLRTPEGEHQVVLTFSGVRWTMYVDGELLDNNFAFGYPQWEERGTWHMDPAVVKQAAIHLPALAPEGTRIPSPDAAPGIQYWTPPGHNAWVGDVVTLFHQGRYHVFYLYDRRHHTSKFGQGAHYFEHLSTTDFKTWTEHEAATPLEEQWECIGTGTPFVTGGKLCLAYGMHTTRVHPRDKTALPAQWDHLKQNGRTGSFPWPATPGFPAGSTYAVSADGVSRFTKSHIMFHPCENPSIYTDPSGALRMIANYGSNGIWESTAIDGGWHCISPGFPPGGDCTFFFRWGAFDYIIGGFTKLWSKPAAAPNTAYEDLVGKGLDFYDGSNVPAISAISDGRYLMAAWIPIGGFGGPLVIRELVQSPDGRIGSKWMPEITPATGAPRLLASRIADTVSMPTEGSAFMLTCQVRPTAAKPGRFRIAFLPTEGDRAACEWQVRPGDGRAQFAPAPVAGFAQDEKTLREGGRPDKVGNYAIGNLINVDQPFTVRVIVKGDVKLGGSLIDAEIAGRRTMITYRAGLTVKRLAFQVDNVELGNVTIAPLE